MIVSHSRTPGLAAVLALVVTATSGSRPAFAHTGTGQSDPVNSSALVPLDEFSPAFLGMYRKVMENGMSAPSNSSLRRRQSWTSSSGDFACSRWIRS